MNDLIFRRYTYHVHMLDFNTSRFRRLVDDWSVRCM